MKRLLFLSMLALPLCGCVTGGNVAKALHELKDDPAAVDVTLTTPWGTAMFHRSFPTNWAPPVAAK